MEDSKTLQVLRGFDREYSVAGWRDSKTLQVFRGALIGNTMLLDGGS